MTFRLLFVFYLYILLLLSNGQYLQSAAAAAAACDRCVLMSNYLLEEGNNQHSLVRIILYISMLFWGGRGVSDSIFASLFLRKLLAR